MSKRDGIFQSHCIGLNMTECLDSLITIFD